mmetsp:Transcript_10179/g.11920  ORF Transcript_10179/g.11920 Transcript_10179/m.11920 type:complete len:908 (-) Transcript_10179:538-3261(-)|eukprot:CAMPEP_0197845728 /NCGR_PEP_ID=MMETSP1438-20131217/2616_1 /TAXON_ID=1461541 /ORGANISM="Pterosperma sp., Strain CCMP1384" /LENGTH=907 /DNA_ID=CAMNT_0043457133 /DNA_START=191 /DNA_END=2914 /DNA_ORIENTATION=+
MAQEPSGVVKDLNNPMKKDEDRDEELEFSPFFGIEKGAVLQESRIFHDPQVDVRRCQQVITKLLYLLNQGDSFSKVEATEVFFAGTKLFQSKDINLRRMVYLMIKEICPSSDEIIIVTSSLMKDMNSKTDLYRSNAIRVLCTISKNDTALLTQVERYLKQAVVDKNAVVASAALVSGMHLMQGSPEIVKRWSNEVQEAVQSKNPLVQAHALALLHMIRQNDRLAVSKLVTSLTRSSVRSPLAQCLLIRYVNQVIAESSSSSNERPFYEFLEGCLRHKAEMVIFEAARAIANMNDVTSRELTPAITVLQLFLSSSKPVLRFAAVRTLNKVAMSHPLAVTNCNIDMESLISDQNRSIATLAITTLLKTGNESSVERLLKQITSFMSDIADEFKIVVVEAIKSLCLKFPQKYPVLMNFLSNILREEGGFEYKKAIVDSILSLIRDIPDAKESGLSHLCEFIEDCEFTYLSTQILNLLGKEGPNTANPAKYIRYIYNRVILENATVRASAVSALAKFGAVVDFLQPRVVILLKRCLHDNDDEVRDRATFYLSALGAGTEGSDEAAKPMLLNNAVHSLATLEEKLRAYTMGDTEERFDMRAATPVGPSAVAASSKSAGGRPGAGGSSAASQPAAGKSSAAPANPADEYSAKLNEIPELAALGQLFKSSTPIELTESETEYKVTCVKHVFPEHFVFQFNCTNTIEEQVLEDVSIIMDATDGDEMEEEFTIPLASMPLNEVAETYVCFRRPENAVNVGKFACTLKFKVKEIDPATGEAEEDGYDDEYQLEEVEVTALDYMNKIAIANFRKAWEDGDEDTEQADVYGLGPRDNLQEAVDAVIEILGMQPCEGTDLVAPNSRSHTCLLAGVFVGFCQVMVRLYFGVDQANSVAVKVAVRSGDPSVSERIHQIISEA